MTVIGIDPGVNTGYALKINGLVLWVKTYPIWRLFEALEQNGCSSGDKNILFVVEDARKRSGSPAAAQGAGWVKTLSGQIEAYLKSKGANYKMIAPIRNGTKLDAEKVKQITGFAERTNEHERDAIMIAWLN